MAHLADYHTHSNCSPDGTVPMTALCAGALQNGVMELCITDHCDFLTLEGAPSPGYDWAPVRQQFGEARAQYGQQLDLRLGLELGVPYLNPAAAQAVLSEQELDFVIGSVHNLSAARGGRDFYCLDYRREEDCYAALDDYFASLQILAESPYYDVIGHVIYPLRYMRGSYPQPIALRRYTEQIRAVLRAAIDSGRGIEVNTWKGQTLAPWIPLLQEYRALGGEIITLGSDAHAPEPLGAGLMEAQRLLQDFGFRYQTSYRERKPAFITL